MRVSAVAIVGFLFLACRPAPPLGVVHISVVDERCRHPVPGTTVTATNRLDVITAVADSYGKLLLSLRPGTWIVEPQLSGTYGGGRQTVHVGPYAQVNVELHIQFFPPGSVVLEPHGPCDASEPPPN
jgi:hypothetical protein